MTEFKLKNEKVEGSDDLGYVLGTYSMAITPPGAPGPVKDSGKFVTIVRRQPDGRWLCRRYVQLGSATSSTARLQSKGHV